MTTPTILDGAGNRLEVGSEVATRYGAAKVTQLAPECVRIATLASGRRVRFVPVIDADAYRCPSLTLLHPPTPTEETP